MQDAFSKQLSQLLHSAADGVVPADSIPSYIACVQRIHSSLSIETVELGAADMAQGLIALLSSTKCSSVLQHAVVRTLGRVILRPLPPPILSNLLHAMTQDVDLLVTAAPILRVFVNRQLLDASALSSSSVDDFSGAEMSPFVSSLVNKAKQLEPPADFSAIDAPLQHFLSIYDLFSPLPQSASTQSALPAAFRAAEFSERTSRWLRHICSSCNAFEPAMDARKNLASLNLTSTFAQSLASPLGTLADFVNRWTSNGHIAALQPCYSGFISTLMLPWRLTCSAGTTVRKSPALTGSLFRAELLCRCAQAVSSLLFMSRDADGIRQLITACLDDPAAPALGAWALQASQTWIRTMRTPTDRVECFRSLVSCMKYVFQSGT